jgi:hypothetical protein
VELGKGIHYNIHQPWLWGGKQGKKANKKDIKQEERKERPRSERKILTDKKENQIFPINKEIHSGAAVAKSYMRKGFIIYEEMRNYFPINEEAVSHIWLCNCSILNFLIYEEN